MTTLNDYRLAHLAGDITGDQMVAAAWRAATYAREHGQPDGPSAHDLARLARDMYDQCRRDGTLNEPRP